MNSLYETIKKYGTGNGEAMMWKSVELISEAVDKSMPEAAKERLVADVYGLMSGGHYNEEYAMRCVSGMYYIDGNGTKRYAPYWTKEQVGTFFADVSEEIPDYNEWDYFVTFNMLASDNWVLFHEWWPGISAEDFAQKIAELSLTWLSDKDWKGSTKIWDYMHLNK